MVHELARRVITRFVEDVIAEAERRLSALQPADAAAIRHAAAPVVAFSAAMAAADRDIKTFLFARMYRHPGVMAVRRRAASIVDDLFATFRRDPSRMPEWCAGLSGPDDPAPRAASPTTSPA